MFGFSANITLKGMIFTLHLSVLINDAKSRKRCMRKGLSSYKFPASCQDFFLDCSTNLRLVEKNDNTKMKEKLTQQYLEWL